VNQGQLQAQIQNELKQRAMSNGAVNGGATANDQTKKPVAWITTMDEIREESTEWLWRNRIALGRMTLIGGDPGTGKTYVSLAIAAAESRGEALPGGGKPKQASNVLLISLEDGLPDVIKPRLRLLDADQSRIAVPNPERSLPATLINASAIEQMVRALGPRLVILDPLMAFASGRNTREGAQMRQMLTPMINLAGKYSFALLVILHLNKGNTKAIYKFQESIDIVAQARSAFIIANDPSDRCKHIMAHAKTNGSIKAPSINFWIHENGSFEWGDESDVDADELVSSEQQQRRADSQVEKAKDFLREALKNGPVRQTELKEKAKESGVQGSIWRAKDELQIRSIKEKVGWFWSLT
jgi:putative DNA primase/helicase